MKATGIATKREASPIIKQQATGSIRSRRQGKALEDRHRNIKTAEKLGHLVDVQELALCL